MLEVIQHNWETKGEFVATFDGQKAGLMTYSWAGEDKIIIDHTEVEPAYNGKGVGKEMVLAAVQFARDNQVKIIPLCPFAKATFAKNTDLGDVLV